MHIALITPFNPKINLGGVERFVNELENCLTKKNIKVDVFFSHLSLPKFLKISHSLSLFYQLKDIKNYDLIHAQGWIGWLSIFKNKIPMITTLHGTTFSATKSTEEYHSLVRNFYNYFVVSNMERLACRYSDYVVSVSKKVESEAKTYYFLDQIKSKVIYNGVDINFFKPNNKRYEKNKPICITVGRLDNPQKGSEFIKDIKRKIKCELVVAGKINNKINAIVKEFKQNDMPSVYNSADIFIQTSRYEGCSFALLEAMACGLPVVTFDNGAAPEIVRDGVDGFLIPFGDVISFADKINLLVEDQNLRKKMGKNARKRAELFSLDKMVKEYIKLYKETI